MGLGSTAKKVQTLAERAEQLYTQILELREQMTELRTTVEATGERVRTLDRRSQEHEAILTAIAESHDIDVEAVLTDAAIEDVQVSEGETQEEDDSESERGDDAEQSG